MYKLLSRDDDYLTMTLDSKSMLEIVSQYDKLHYLEKEYFVSIGYIFSCCEHKEVCQYIVDQYFEILYSDLSRLNDLIYTPWKMEIIQETYIKIKPLFFDFVSDFIFTSDIIDIIWIYTVDFKNEFPYGEITIFGSTQYLKLH